MKFFTALVAFLAISSVVMSVAVDGKMKSLDLTTVNQPRILHRRSCGVRSRCAPARPVVHRVHVCRPAPIRHVVRCHPRPAVTVQRHTVRTCGARPVIRVQRQSEPVVPDQSSESRDRPSEPVVPDQSSESRDQSSKFRDPPSRLQLPV